MKPKIEDIKIDLDLLNKELETPLTDKRRQYVIRQDCGGFCTRCMDIPTKKVSYDIGDARLLELYCDRCFKYMKERRSKKNIEKLN